MKHSGKQQHNKATGNPHETGAGQQILTSNACTDTEKYNILTWQLKVAWKLPKGSCYRQAFSNPEQNAPKENLQMDPPSPIAFVLPVVDDVKANTATSLIKILKAWKSL